MAKAKEFDDSWGKDNCQRRLTSLNSNYHENFTIMREQRNLEKKGLWGEMMAMTSEKHGCFLYFHTLLTWESPKVLLPNPLLFLLSPWVTKHTINYHLITQEAQTPARPWPSSQTPAISLQQLSSSSSHSPLLPKAGPSTTQSLTSEVISHSFLPFNTFPSPA